MLVVLVWVFIAAMLPLGASYADPLGLLLLLSSWFFYAWVGKRKVERGEGAMGGKGLQGGEGRRRVKGGIQSRIVVESAESAWASV